MKRNEMIKQGRRYANGDGVMIDLDRAYELWKPVAEELRGEDRELFEELRGDAEGVSPVTEHTEVEQGVLRGDGDAEIPDIAYHKAAVSRSENEIRELFELILGSNDERSRSRLYNALARVRSEQTAAPKERKPEHIRFGNNLGFIMYQFSWNRVVFRAKMNERLAAVNRSQSGSALSQILNGINGMDPAAQLELVKMINETNLKKRLLRREMTVADLRLSLHELVALFYNPKLDDERIRKLLEE